MTASGSSSVIVRVLRVVAKGRKTIHAVLWVVLGSRRGYLFQVYIYIYIHTHTYEAAEPLRGYGAAEVGERFFL